MVAYFVLLRVGPGLVVPARDYGSAHRFAPRVLPRGTDPFPNFANEIAAYVNSSYNSYYMSGAWSAAVYECAVPDGALAVSLPVRIPSLIAGFSPIGGWTVYRVCYPAEVSPL